MVHDVHHELREHCQRKTRRKLTFAASTYGIAFLNTMALTSSFAFPLHPRQYAPQPVPSLEEWRKLWEAWDMVTTKMIPREALMEKPIPLRNPLLFYLGHIPTLYKISELQKSTAKDLLARTYTLLEPRMASPLNPATTLSSSSEELIQMLITQRTVIVTVNFPMNGQRSQRSLLFEHRFAKGLLPYTKTERRGRIVKWGELCGLDLSMRVRQTTLSLGRKTFHQNQG